MKAEFNHIIPGNTKGKPNDVEHSVNLSSQKGGSKCFYKSLQTNAGYK